jgi:excisionase family DNA binding protein
LADLYLLDEAHVVRRTSLPKLSTLLAEIRPNMTVAVLRHAFDDRTKRISQRPPKTPKLIGPIEIGPGSILTAAQASAYLQVPTTTLAVWRSTNRVVLPYFKLGGHVRYRREDLDRFIEENMHNVSASSGGNSSRQARGKLRRLGQ